MNSGIGIVGNLNVNDPMVGEGVCVEGCTIHASRASGGVIGTGVLRNEDLLLINTIDRDYWY